MISIDGFKPEYLDELNTPTLLNLAKEGAVAKGMLPVFPSQTFPNHYSMVTGLYPDHHGIVNNTMIDPKIPETFKLSSRAAVTNSQWWEDGVPIWVSAQQQGKKTATLFWPGSEAKIRGIQPNDWLAYDKNLLPTDRVNRLLLWLNRPNQDRADFATLYFEDVDSSGHRYGPNSVEVKESTKVVDRAIQELITGLQREDLLQKTTLIIVSDHGMAEVKAEQSINLKKLLSAFAKLNIIWQGPIAGINLQGESLEGVLSSLQQNKDMQCWAKSAIPAKYHFGQHRRVPDIVCLAKLGYTILDGTSLFTIPGQHGYDPELKDMHGLFIANGYKIKKTQLSYFENIEVYPLINHLLQIKSEKNDAQNILYKQIIME
jgi:ectonucleotide pyrophosphatase/phosphodiesterase family member 5